MPAPDNDTVEAVAKVLWEAGCRDYIGGFHSPPPWEKAHPGDRKMMRRSARAAIREYERLTK